MRNTGNGGLLPRHHWTAAEEGSFFTGRGLVAIAVLLVAGAYTLKAFGITEPEWVKDVLLMLIGGILTAYNTRPEQRSSSVEVKTTPGDSSGAEGTEGAPEA